jgi:phosphoglycerol transferase MdoB-like AlkP superfamily enzyme
MKYLVTFLSSIATGVLSLYILYAAIYGLGSDIIPNALGVGGLSWSNFVIEAGITVGLASFFVMIFRSPSKGGMGSLLFVSLIAFINRLKFNETGQILVPADLYFLSSPRIFLHYINGIYQIAAIVGAVLVMVTGYLYFRKRERSKTWRGLHFVTLLPNVLFGIFLVLGVSRTNPHAATLFERIFGSNSQFDVSEWRPHETMLSRGFATTFARQFTKIKLGRPESLSFSDSIRIVTNSEVDGQSSNDSGFIGATQDGSMIILLLESWIDTDWLNLQFNQDPIPNFHEFQKESLSFKILSPVYGGGTANVEFELLTGLNLAAFNAGTYPYLHHVRRPMLSLVRSFADSGYRTVAIHNYDKDMWHRSVVFPLLGFERFESQDNFITSPTKYFMHWPDDTHLFENLENQLSNGDKVFIYGATMVTHGPYVPNLPFEKEIKILSTKNNLELSNDTKEALEVYFNKLHQADKALGRLKSIIAEHPTVNVIAFGDHQPGVLGYPSDIINHSLLAADIPPNLGINMDAARNLITPAFIRPGSNSKFSGNVPKIVSPTCLPDLALQLASMKRSPVFNYLERDCGEKPVQHPDPNIVTNGSTIDSEYKNVAYDIIFNSDDLEKKLDEFLRVELKDQT